MSAVELTETVGDVTDAAGEVLVARACRGDADAFGALVAAPLSPDGTSVIVDNGDDLVIAPIDGTGSRTLPVNGRPMAWRPIP
jgi:hypothetical protein